MSVQTHSEPLQCPECDSINASKDAAVGDGLVVCYDCGVVFPDGSDKVYPEITASILRCPHCKEVGVIKIFEGREECQECRLDPNDPDIPTHHLAHLWKSRTNDTPEDDKTIREIMEIPKEDGTPKLPAGTSVGEFLRTECGPHCARGIKCNQTTGDFTQCYRMYREARGTDMSKKRNKKGKQRRSPEEKAAKRNKRAKYIRLHSRAWLFSPPKGWFVSEKNYESETIYKEQSES